MKSFFFCLNLLTAALCTAGPAQEHVSISVGGLIITTAQIDQKPIRLIVDTGATHTTLDLQLVHSLFPNTPIHPIEIKGTTNAKEAPKMMQASVSLCGLSVPGSSVFLLNLDGLRQIMADAIGGILGMDIMQRKAFRFLASAPLFEFTAKATPSAEHKQLTGIIDKAGRLHTAIRAGSRDISLLLDTGSSVTAVSEDLWEAGAEKTVDYDSADINGRTQGKVSFGAPMDITVGNGLILKNVRPLLLPKGSPGILGLDALKNVEILYIPSKSGGNEGTWYGRTINQPITK